LAWLSAGVWCVAYLATTLSVRAPVAGYAGNALVLVAGLALAVGAALSAKRARRNERLLWLALLATGALTATGDLLAAIDARSMAANVCYVASYGPMFVMVTALSRAKTRSPLAKARAVLDVIALATVLGALTHLFVRNELVARTPALDFGASMFTVVFAVLDFILLVAVAAIALDTRGVVWRQWELLLVAAVASSALIGVWSTRVMLQPQLAPLATVLDGLSTLAPYVLATLACVYYLSGDTVREEPMRSNRVIGSTVYDYIVPGIAVAAVPFLAWQALRSGVPSVVRMSTIAVTVLALALTLRSLVLSYENSTLFRATLTDPLTGLYNTRMQQERLSEAIAFAKRTGSPLSVVSVDIDEFALVNNQYGHDVGDECLRHVAGELSRSIRESDVACRIGGDEFSLIMPSASAEEAGVVCSRLRELLSTGSSPCGEAIRVSCGIAVYSPQAPDAESLIRGADAAMYWVKYHGRDGTMVYQPEMAGVFDRERQSTSTDLLHRREEAPPEAPSTVGG
jgi:diguanylate cyclase (GGDEF)-like protein